MPDIALIETEHFDCVIWTKDVSTSQQRLQRSMQKRGAQVAASVIRFSPALSLNGKEEPTAELALDTPVFFENKYYELEFIFHPVVLAQLGGEEPVIEHKLRSIEEAFHFSDRNHSLRGTVNTGNNIGAFQFQLTYPFAGERICQSFSFDVLPLKMDLHSDFKAMNEAVDAVFPLWRFSLAEHTQHQLGAVKKPHAQFLLLWFARFESLHQALFTGLRHILNAPHSRLMEYTYTTRMAGLKGRLSPKQEERLALAKGNRNDDKRFVVSKKTLHIDTPENRFIKATLEQSIIKLEKIRHASCSLMRSGQLERSGQPQLSNSFLKQLEHWQQTLRRFRSHPFFREVGKFKGLTKESLVLQQKPGYSKVYKTWQQLKWYLELLDGVDQLSLRNVAEMYEVWCFLEIRRILLDLKFEEKAPSKIPLISNDISVSLKDGMAGAFKFTRSDGITIRLAHEPIFRKKEGDGIRTWLVNQKPDILLEACFPDGTEIIWLFDAKYRIYTPRNEQGAEQGMDKVPDDAINQMHRYRDALIHRQKLDDKGYIKTRPVFGAYALYPGYFNQLVESNPYSKAINEIGIGAFSLLPQEDNKGSYWLTKFLKQRLRPVAAEHQHAASERHFVEKPSRISGKGYTKVHYQGLTILANQLGPNRNQDYIEQFNQGEARYYHTKLHAFARQHIQQYLAMEAHYLAVALDTEDGTKRKIEFIYPILAARHLKRSELTEAETGTISISNPDEYYWLFRLGAALQLKKPVWLPINKHFELKLVSREDLSKSYNWETLPELYLSLKKASP